MTTTAISTTNGHNADVIESVIMQGDLSKLTPNERVSYYMQVCRSLGLNPNTRPFDYITLQGKLTLYARKDAAEQLRSMRGISINKPEIQIEDELMIVSVTATDRNGRTDSDIGAVNAAGLRGDARANAIMKAITKAKRRVTLSICGLGMLDETEIETIPDARPVSVDSDGVIARQPPQLTTASWELALNSWQFQKSRAIKHGGLEVQIERCKPHADAAKTKDVAAVLAAAECLGKVVDVAIGEPSEADADA